MSSDTSLDGIRPVPPLLPDFHLCDRIYGSDLKITDCGQVRLDLLAQVRPGSYYTNFITATGPSFPIVVSHGDCMIKIEAAGPNLPRTLPVDPVVLGNMAYWLITRCVVAMNGLGGFVTNGLSALQEYATNLDHDPRDTFRKAKHLVNPRNSTLTPD